MYFMKFLYPRPKVNLLFSSSVVRIAVAMLFLISAFTVAANAQSAPAELVFKNSVLETGMAGADGAIYRFPSVRTGVDALVKINGRSSALVGLVSIDLTNTGHGKAFQPQVTYNNNTSPAGTTDWWMEFQISFVESATTKLIAVKQFDVTGLDIDGNGDKISEYVCFYSLKSYTLEQNSSLAVSNMMENVYGSMTNTGKLFLGPVTNHVDIDTSATDVMTTNNYQDINSFRLRTGARSTGVSGAADRMYSFWFKGFAFQDPITGTLPVSLTNWTATYTNNNIALKWTTTVEKNASHFIIERSFDGVEYADAAMIFAVGNSDITNNYSYNDKIAGTNNGVIYYRLKMVDMDGKAKTSAIRMVRVGQASEAVKIMAYPNPVINDLRITIPQNWQDKQVSYQVINTGGQIVKSITIPHASQTEMVSMTQVPAGMYIVKVTNGNETGTQTIVKSKD
jgi:Secretion system C-terminal sorting domain